MLSSITLLCNPAAPILTPALVGRCGALIRDAGWTVATIVRLGEGVACDLIAEANAPAGDIAERIRSRLAAPVDVVVQPAEGRRKRLLVADMDSTIIGQECLDELADFAGRRPEIAAITARAMRGEIEFEAALLTRVSMLRGLPESALHETFARRIALNPGAATLVRTMKKFGAATALVSGGFTFFTERVAAAAGFDFHESNALIVEGGALTGEVAPPIKGRAAKEEALVRLAANLDMPLSETLAVGDGANDLAMLGRAGLGVAFHAKPTVAAAAHARIDHGDLTALLYLQGIPQAEFIESRQ